MFLLFYCSTITLVISISFTRMMHPLAMGMTLLTQTVFVCLIAGLLSKHMWFSYILFLIFLGALLVLFIYVASLASNESFSLSIPTTLMVGYSLLTLPMFMLMDPLLPSLKHSVEKSFLCLDQLMQTTQYNLMMIYNPSSMNLTLFIILYLLLTLVVVVKISSTFFGPLRLS
uniref:NADH-ubiquinone oxidoreductase chain 6 n=1 Tax=Chlorotocus crassicornis TaxID=1073559 RepID=A0A343J2P2_9EUCA|nr:NADH dehydrogenase subunit 6 [Chlorotocus crassicornis]ASU92684.1 NADH dehydrogenase subunit 6 [Chlorotocus crassicornis]